MSSFPLSRGAWSRRRFLQRISRYGAGAVLGSMFALELLADDRRFRLRLDGRAPERRRRVIVLGGGMAGLSVAYELGRIGYTCTVLEARARPGGRCWTVRGGTEGTEIGHGPQVARFASGLYFDAGPMRISHHHTTTLGYCREFGVPLSVFTNLNHAAYIVRRGHPRLRIREVTTDIDGYFSELLAKVVRRGELDLPLSADDRERLIEYLREQGRLNADLVYPRAGDTSENKGHLEHTRGYTLSPGALGGPGEPTGPVDLELLVKAGYGHSLGFMKNVHQQPTMLAPVGGMDRLAHAFAERLGEVVRYRTEVVEVRRTTAGGVRIVYADGARGGETAEIEGDFCVCALPPNLLCKLPSDFSAAVGQALAGAQPGAAGKIGLQFKRRFWEEDDDIYGGSSKTDETIGQVYYPWDNYGASGPGVMVGYYHFGGEAEQLLDDQPYAERERVALEQGARIHPQYPEEFESSFSVAWRRVPYNQAAWALWPDEASFDAAQATLHAGDGPFHFAGDWVSNLVGWQAGAFVAAHRVCQSIHHCAMNS